MKRYLLLALLAFSVSSKADVASDIKHVVQLNLIHTQNENISEVLATMHSQSPGYVATKQMLDQLFPMYDLVYEILDYNYVSSDGTYAYARVRMKTSKVSGPAFQNNEIDALQVFKKENGQWRLWTQANLEIKYI